MIKQIYEALDKEQKELLKYAFEHSLTQLVDYEENKFIGVNVVGTATIIIDEGSGYWSIGHYVKDSDKQSTQNNV